MKRLISLLLAAALCAGLAGCSDHYERQKRKEALDELNGYTTIDYSLKDGSRLEQTVIYEKEGIKVTILGMKEDDYSICLWARLENGSDRKVRFSVEDLVADSWEINGSLWLEAEKGGIDRKCAYLDADELATVAPEGFGTLTVNGTVMDEEYQTLDRVSAQLKVTGGGTAMETPELQGQVLYDDMGVHLEYLGVAGSRYSKYLQFYVKNDRDAPVNLRNDDGVFAQGRYGEVKLTSGIYERVGAGHKRIVMIWMDDSQLNGQTLSELPVKLNLDLVDSEYYSSIAELRDVELNTGVNAASETDTESSAGQVLYDMGGIRLTYLGTSDDEGDTEFLFLAENNRKEPVSMESVEGIIWEDSEGMSYELTDSIDVSLEPGAAEMIPLSADPDLWEQYGEGAGTLSISELSIVNEDSGEEIDWLTDVVLEAVSVEQDPPEETEPAEESTIEEAVSA